MGSGAYDDCLVPVPGTGLLCLCSPGTRYNSTTVPVSVSHSFTSVCGPDTSDLHPTTGSYVRVSGSVWCSHHIHLHHLSSSGDSCDSVHRVCYVTRTLSKINKVLIINTVRGSLGIGCKHTVIHQHLVHGAMLNINIRLL